MSRQHFLKKYLIWVRLGLLCDSLCGFRYLRRGVGPKEVGGNNGTGAAMEPCVPMKALSYPLWSIPGIKAELPGYVSTFEFYVPSTSSN